MKKPWLIAVVVALVLVLGAAGALWLSRPHWQRIAGEPAALARSAPEAESVAPAALEAARLEAVQQRWQGLVVHRHGHRVFEYFAAGRDGEEQVDGGVLGGALLRLSLTAGDADPHDATATAALVSERVWLPLHAADAALAYVGQVPQLRARLDDWMRVGDLLLGQGTYHGERIVAVDAVRQLAMALLPAPWQGDEPLLARDALWFDLEPGLRLWLAPRRGLAVLAWAGEASRDTRIPNIILRGLNDQAPTIGDGGLEDIVPGHLQ
jgi:hypothetical protein